MQLLFVAWLQMDIGFQDEILLSCVGCPHSHAAFAPKALALATLLTSAPQGLCTPVGCGLCPVLIVHMDTLEMAELSVLYGGVAI